MFASFGQSNLEGALKARFGTSERLLGSVSWPAARTDSVQSQRLVLCQSDSLRELCRAGPADAWPRAKLSRLDSKDAMNQRLERFLRLVKARAHLRSMTDRSGSTRQYFPIREQATQELARRAQDARALAGESFQGVCPVCGRAASFDSFNGNLRESGTCSECGSNNRNRQLAALVRRRFGMRAGGPFRFPARFTVYSAEANGPVHNQLKRAP